MAASSSSPPKGWIRLAVAAMAGAAAMALATLTVTTQWRRRSSRKRGRAAATAARSSRGQQQQQPPPLESLHVHLHLSGVTLREEDLGLLRRLLHAKVTLTHGPDIARGTQLLIANFPDPKALAAHKASLQAVLFPFAGIPPHMLQFMTRELPHCSVHNLHHNAPATAEMALALLLAAAKRVLPADGLLRKNDWKAGGGPSLTITLEEEHAGQTILEGRTAMIFGYGAIGRLLARACRGMGMRVKAVRREIPSPSSSSPDSDSDDDDDDDDRESQVEMVAMRDIRTHLPTAAAVLLCLPGTPETEGVIGRAELALLPEDAVLVNVGRGSAVDEAALYEALKQRKIHGAGLDVWWQYPTKERPRMPPSRFDFAALDNVVMSPHRGGAAGVADSETRRMRELARVVNAAVARGGGGDVRAGLGNRVCASRGY